MSNLDDLIICTNPTRRDLKNIFQKEKYARGIILKNGDVMVWNGEVMHNKVTPYLPETGVHFNIFNDKLEICYRAESWKDIQTRLIQAQKYFQVLGFPDDGQVVFDTMFYTHTKIEFPPITYAELFQEGYEIKPLDDEKPGD